jgi:succinate dehydrogenase / fumarate reductase, membrane anchor subunit
MAYVTDRKRAAGLGASKTGTLHHWRMMVSSVALIVLVPLFVFTFGTAVGMTHDEVLAYYAQPFPAIVAGLTLVVGFQHFASGIQTAIEDYAGGLTRKALVIAMTCLSWGAAAVGLFAIARLAF